MSESGSRDAAAGLAAHSKDATGSHHSAHEAKPDRSSAGVADSTEELLRALLARIVERPLTALLVAGAAGWVLGRMGKYI